MELLFLDDFYSFDIITCFSCIDFFYSCIDYNSHITVTLDMDMMKVIPLLITQKL